MKKLLLFIPVYFLFLLTTNATDYYIAANGSDANNGTSQSSPWKSLNKLNAYFSSLRPGDRVLLHRGDTFYGSITVNKSGKSGAPITIGAYGSGTRPVITGFKNITNWRNTGGNIWESVDEVSSLSYTNMVVINEINTPMGRYPNTGYMTYQSHSGKSSITSKDLNGSTNWTGAEVAMFMATFTIGRNLITGHSGNTLYYKSGPSDEKIQYDNQGFFIQNDIRTLDVQNEWYYNSKNKKLSVFSVGSPTNVRVTNIDTLLETNEKDHVIIDELKFEGSNKSSIVVNHSKYFSITNCDIVYAGGDAITGPFWGNSTGLLLQNNNIQNVNNTAVALVTEFDNAKIIGNTIKNVGMIPGMGGNGSIGNCFAIHTTAPNNLIEGNIIQNIGYIGISFHGNNTIIKNNFVDGFCLVMHDGGGIYTWNIWPNTEQSGIKVIDNIVINGSTNTGIYLDDNANGIEATGNTVANCYNGIYLHNNWNMKVNNNTSFNNIYASLNIRNDNPSITMYNIEFKDNILFAKSSEQRSAYLYLLEKFSGVNTSGNYYAKPINNSRSIDTYYNGVYGYKPLSTIQNITGKETNSKEAPKSITDENDIRFEYNATFSSKTISLDANYIDVKGNNYNGTITLAPFKSAVLIRNGDYTNQQPVANAGVQQVIQLPVNRIELFGTGSDPDGTISSYNWTKLAGGAANILSPREAHTDVTGLEKGTYQFILSVTDNMGSFAYDTVSIIVNSSVALLPAMDPGSIINGLAYDYYEGKSFSIVPDFSELTPVKSGSVTSFDIAVSNKSEIFALNFTGYINIPADGEYTFYTNSDDGSILYIDDNIVVNNDGLHGPIEASGSISLKAGYHLIRVGYFQQTGGKNLSVNYSGTGIQKQNIPESKLFRTKSTENLLPAQYPENTTSGLDYKYFEGGKYSALPDFSKITPTKLGTVENFKLDPANRGEAFAFNYTGYINVPADGQYTFYTMSDDGSNLFIDGRLVVSNDRIQYNTEKSGTIGLQAGKHQITVGYFQQGGGKMLNVNYEGPGFLKRAVSDNELFRVVYDDEYLPALNPINVVNGIDFQYFEDKSYFAIPNFTYLSPVKSGATNDFNIKSADKNNSFAFNFSGYIDVPADGHYTFYAMSDDGSKLYIDGELVVDNDGIHFNKELSGTIGLKAGKHAISVGYFQQTGNKILNISYSSQGILKQTIPGSILYRSLDPFFSRPLASREAFSDNQNLSAVTKAYPNPFVNSVKVTLGNAAGTYEIQVVDVMGRVLLNRTGSKNLGYYEQTVNTSSLQKGVYLIRVKQNGLSSTIKVEKH